LSKLDKYNEKRNFNKTNEPKSGSKKEGENIFVIQKHDASNLHYDLRLEIDGVLKSWAVPKGPSTDPSERRLALPTEDHPLEYSDFEGVIPEDNYGAGKVIVWDTGSFENTTEKDGEKINPLEALDIGHITFRLNGKKLKGEYSLFRTSKGKNEQWLLVKMKDDHADARRNPTSTEPESVISGKTLEELNES
jgi:DNA ligase D-like protein (predicted 3'-phosphoesterase)